jgi:hypothetical protein
MGSYEELPTDEAGEENPCWDPMDMIMGECLSIDDKRRPKLVVLARCKLVVL